jgi:hypothetical protein
MYRPLALFVEKQAETRKLLDDAFGRCATIGFTGADGCLRRQAGFDLCVKARVDSCKIHLGEILKADAPILAVSDEVSRNLMRLRERHAAAR